MKIPVTFIFAKDDDPLYKMIGLQNDADGVEIIEDGILDTTTIEAISDNAGTTMIYTKGGHAFNIDTSYEEFLDIYLKLD
jgi:hypothetical protein